MSLCLISNCKMTSACCGLFKIQLREYHGYYLDMQIISTYNIEHVEQDSTMLSLTVLFDILIWLRAGNDQKGKLDHVSSSGQ